MKRRNLTLFLIILIIAFIWGAVYWYFIAPFAGPNK